MRGLMKRFIICFCSLALLFLPSCSTQRVQSKLTPYHNGSSAEDLAGGDLDTFFKDFERPDTTPIEWELHDHHLVKKYNWKPPPSDFPLVINDKVLGWMEYFTGRGRKIYGKWLKRKAQEEALILEILKEYQLPEDLIYLSMIESGFNPKAYSHAHASGPWQFIRSTGKRYGLESNYWIDERRDTEKSTHAAARHLRDLYREFDDWFLAAAAYNAGSGKIKRAIKRHHTRDYWKIVTAKSPYLRVETKNYVPKMLAALIIGKQPERFGFKKYEVLPPKDFDEAFIEGATDLKVVAKSAGVHVDEIRELNPEIRLWNTPPGENYYIRLPVNKKQQFLENYSKIPPEKRVTFRRHVIRQGQTLGYLASRYGTHVDAIMDLNNINNPRKVSAGRSLVIPVPKYKKIPSNSYSSKPVMVSSKPEGHKAKTIVVQKGDTLWDLANKYAVSLQSLRSWNALLRTSRIYPGDELTIYIKDG